MATPLRVVLADDPLKGHTPEHVDGQVDEVLESLGNTSEQVLSMVKYALMRIEDGTYAYCDECGEAIPEARLESVPYTAHCVDCAEKIEN